MVIFFFLFLLILINFIFIFFINKKKIKKFLYQKKIKSVSIESIDPIFTPNKYPKNIKFPSETTVCKMVFVHDKEYNIKGLVSDYESWILANIAKKSKNIFEFGTCSGKTTYLMALNSPKNCKIKTITLNNNQASSILYKKGESKSAFKNIKNESFYDVFFFSNTKEEKKINVKFINSMNLKIDNMKKMFDLIFIDGGHTYQVVKNDTEKALQMINKNGLIFWHDYIEGKSSTKDVVKYLNQLSKKIKIFHIKDTNMCFFKSNK